MSSTDRDSDIAKMRKLRARIFNERVKLLVAGLHVLSLAQFILGSLRSEE